jgi:predicted aminopeptidase
MVDMHSTIERYNEQVQKIIESQKTKDGLPSQIEERDAIIVTLTLEMRDFANSKYKVFQKLWQSFDIFSVLCAISISFWLLIHFLCYGVLDNTIRISRFSLALMAFFYG